jgi:hypothetical protein
MAAEIWRVRSLETDYRWEGPLEAIWEVSHDPISDDYTPEETEAGELLHMWAEQVREVYPDGLVPIYWFVYSEGQGKFERMPFQRHLGDAEDFLTYFSWPVSKSTGERLNWLTLPVADKLWNEHRANKGGFIQEATGWKPSILQPYVFLDSLLKGADFAWVPCGELLLQVREASKEGATGTGARGREKARVTRKE